jgi:hypothetical protein
MKLKHKHLLFIAAGLALVAIGLFAIHESQRAIAGLCVGIGAGLAGMNLAQYFIDRYYESHPQERRQSEIVARDERTQLIADRSKARAFDVMIRALMLIPFLLIVVDAPLWVILATIAVYLTGFGVQIYYTTRFNREL